MRKLISGLALLAACSSGTTTTTTTAVSPVPPPGGSTTGAASPREAVQMFMTAVKDSNLQAMSAVWGDKDGLARDKYPSDALFQREMIMVCFLSHESYKIISDAQAKIEGERAFIVEVTRRPLTRTTTFRAAPGASGRWYVSDVDLDPLRELCANRRPPGGSMLRQFHQDPAG